MRRARNAALLAVVVLALALPASVSSATTVNVFAAASLTGVFPKIDGSERYSFAGSDQLALQIRQGAPADVFASASPKYTELAYRDLADQFDHVKDARRDSYPKAIAALLAVQHSEPAKASIRAAERLRKLGFRVPVSATIGSGT